MKNKDKSGGPKAFKCFKFPIFIFVWAKMCKLYVASPPVLVG
jgi:hypothetical protein